MDDDDSFLQEEDYPRHRWSEADLWPAGCQVAKPRMEGPGIRWHHANPVILLLLEGVRLRALCHLATWAARCTGV